MIFRWLPAVGVLIMVVLAATDARASAIRANVEAHRPACIRVRLDPALPTGLTLRVSFPDVTPRTHAVAGRLADRLNVVYELPGTTQLKLELLDTSTPANVIAAVKVRETADIYGSDNNLTTSGPPLSGPSDGNPPASPYAQCRTDVTLFLRIPAGGPFLTRPFGGTGGSEDEATAYYGVVDPRNKRRTLRQWWILNGFDRDGNGGVRAAYLNDNDLGFGRDVRCLQRGADVACYVTNYGKPLRRQEYADNAYAADRSRAETTLAIEVARFESMPQFLFDLRPGGRYADMRVVKFFAFQGGTALAPRITTVDLDWRGPKSVPRVCTVCHGGSYAPSGAPSLADVSGMIPRSNGRGMGDDRPSLLPFDLSQFKYPVAMPRQNQEPNFYELNQLVKASDPAPAIKDLIGGWYERSRVQDTRWVPLGWRAVPGVAPISSDELYRQVVAPSCRTCHIAQRDAASISVNGYPIVPFATFETFKRLAANGGIASNHSLVQAMVCGQDTPWPQAKVMPNSAVTFGNFWSSTSPSRPGVLAAFSNHPDWTAFPSCR